MCIRDSNVHAGGMAFGSDPGSLEYLVGRAREAARRPLIVKLSPNVTSIAHMARICAAGGADAVSLTNTFLAMSIDTETRQPRLSNVTGGLSGPAIKPISLRMVYETARAVSIPIIGMGGIVKMCIRDRIPAVRVLPFQGRPIQRGLGARHDFPACLLYTSDSN